MSEPGEAAYAAAGSLSTVRSSDPHCLPPFPAPSGVPSRTGLGGCCLELRQHHGVSPLVHNVGHRHLAPAVVTGALGVVDLGAPGHPAADAHGAAALERALDGPVTGAVTV